MNLLIMFLGWGCLFNGIIWCILTAKGRDVIHGARPGLRKFAGPVGTFLFGLILLSGLSVFGSRTDARADAAHAHKPAHWRVIDGDTVELSGVKFRIPDMDSPETTYRAKCAAERELGKMATAYAKDVLGGALVIEPARKAPFKTDRYGRALSDLLVDGNSYRDLMIAGGYARDWDYGHSPKPDWCGAP